MNILVIVRQVPDVVEELEVAADGKSLDSEFLRMIISESDDHALEEALLLKERHGGKVTVLAPDAPDIDDALYSALAKGADRVVKVEGIEGRRSTRHVAAQLAQVIASQGDSLAADLVLTGVQAIEDLDGLMAPLLAHHLNLPHLAIVTKVTVDEAARKVSALREFAGGVRCEFELPLPAVLGIQAAEKPPRYVPVAKVRAAMKSQRIDTLAAGGVSEPLLMEILALKKPEAAGHAEMLAGSPEEAASRLVGILSERGVI